MRRRLFNLASAVSLLLCLGTVGIWMYGSDIYCRTEANVGRWWFQANFCDGTIGFAGTPRLHMERPNFAVMSRNNTSDEWPVLVQDHAEWYRAGIEVQYGTCVQFLTPGTYGRWWSVTLPPWLVTTLFGSGGLYFIVTLVRTRRSKGNWCQRCRYDLTGNTSGVCPECGTPCTPVSFGG